MFTATDSSRRPPGARAGLQNGKLDLGGPRQDPSWFPVAAGPVSRTPGAQSFAQTIGGGAGQSRPFDPSEFPSLGGNAPQTATWAVNKGPGQGSPPREVRRPFGRGNGIRSQDDAARSSESLPPGAEGYRFGSGQTNQTANRGSARSPFPEQEPIGYTGRGQEQPQSSLLPNSDGASSPHASIPQQSIDGTAQSSKRIADMTDREKYGIAGLIARMTPGHPDFDPLTNGFDLTKLGINMDSSEPLINTWPGPLDDSNLCVPDYICPPAYKVDNVPPLPTKMESFSDETLIMIFYQHPRDILQELAAQALYKREWRWHKVMRCWMMKDNSAAQFGQMTRLSEKAERGMYILFDVNAWRRERKELILNFEDLDTRPGLMQGTGLNGNGVGAVSGTPVAATNGLGGGFGSAGAGFGGGAATFGGVGT